MSLLCVLISNCSRESFVLMNSTQNGDYFFLGWERNRTRNSSACSCYYLNDFCCRRVYQLIIETLQSDSDFSLTATFIASLIICFAATPPTEHPAGCFIALHRKSRPNRPDFRVENRAVYPEPTFPCRTCRRADDENSRRRTSSPQDFPFSIQK